jgi:hypothetical protein
MSAADLAGLAKLARVQQEAEAERRAARRRAGCSAARQRASGLEPRYMGTTKARSGTARMNRRIRSTRPAQDIGPLALDMIERKSPDRPPVFLAGQARRPEMVHTRFSSNSTIRFEDCGSGSEAVIRKRAERDAERRRRKGLRAPSCKALNAMPFFRKLPIELVFKALKKAALEALEDPVELALAESADMADYVEYMQHAMAREARGAEREAAGRRRAVQRLAGTEGAGGGAESDTEAGAGGAVSGGHRERREQQARRRERRAEQARAHRAEQRAELEKLQLLLESGTLHREQRQVLAAQQQALVEWERAQEAGGGGGGANGGAGLGDGDEGRGGGGWEEEEEEGDDHDDEEEEEEEERVPLPDLWLSRSEFHSSLQRMGAGSGSGNATLACLNRVFSSFDVEILDCMDILKFCMFMDMFRRSNASGVSSVSLLR